MGVHGGDLAGALEEGLDAVGEIRVVGVLLDDDLAEVAVVVPGEFFGAADEVRFEVGPADAVAVLDLQDDGFDEAGVLLHIAVLAGGVLRAREGHALEPAIINRVNF